MFYAVPTFYAAFLASPAAPQRAELKLRRCVSAGEALPTDIGRRWSERYGTDILDGLGSTEMLHIFLSNRPGEVKYGTTGKPVPGYDVRLVDDDGEVVKARGDMGELQVRGPTSAMMYWNNRDQSRATFLGEWTRSGDKYVEDDDGHYVYCGRRDDMLKVSGMYVSPFEVEGVLQSHPDVLEAAVVGWPDTDALIKPKAFVVLKTPELACADFAQRLQDECRQKLAVYKYPRWIEFRSELPKTATGKIQRFKLRAEAPQREVEGLRSQRDDDLASETMRVPVEDYFAVALADQGPDHFGAEATMLGRRDRRSIGFGPANDKLVFYTRRRDANSALGRGQSTIFGRVCRQFVNRHRDRLRLVGFKDKVLAFNSDASIGVCAVGRKLLLDEAVKVGARPTGTGE